MLTRHSNRILINTVITINEREIHYGILGSILVSNELTNTLVASAKQSVELGLRCALWMDALRCGLEFFGLFEGNTETFSSHSRSSGITRFVLRTVLLDVLLTLNRTTERSHNNILLVQGSTESIPIFGYRDVAVELGFSSG